MSWVDEYYKGHLNTNACAQGGRAPGRPRCACGWSWAGSDACAALSAWGGAPALSCLDGLHADECAAYWQEGGLEPAGCPDWDASRHSACGTFHYRGQPDDWLNEVRVRLRVRVRVRVKVVRFGAPLVRMPATFGAGQ